MTVYRVAFVGPDFANAALSQLTQAGLTWEGSQCSPREPCRHTALVEADSDDEAVERTRHAVRRHGSFGHYAAALVRNAQGEPWQGPFYRSWQDVDWESPPDRASLTELERTVLWALMNDHEPTWTIARDPDVHGNAGEIEAALQRLEQRKLVDSRSGASGEPGRETEQVPWWAITDEGWDLLGFIKSPHYR